jgi:hypothetical protein
MKHSISHLSALLILVALLSTTIKAAETAYYFGPDARFNPEIPSPEQFLGFKTGTRLTHHHEIVSYFRELDRLSDRTQLKIIGYTHEEKPLLALVVSSAHNLENLEQIRQDHLKVLDPQSSFDQNTLPVISFLAYSVHGNENSAAEAALLTAYYLVASEDEKIDQYLTDGIFIIKPNRNPDGHDRHAHWVNTRKGKNPVADPADIEHNEGYPGGRGNHYWFDLNRDWIPAIHPESQARLEFFHSWVPHVATCHHEMGTNSTFFFEPTRPVDNESPLVPRAHYDLNNKFGEYYASALDNIGSLYFTKEVFDNFNPTFGSSYPDYNGTLAILIEQGSSRGIVQERRAGVITFPEAIRNQLVTSIATIKASIELKPELVANQKSFFRTAIENGTRSTVKGYVFGDAEDQSRTLRFARLLRLHNIQVFENEREINTGGQVFKPGSSFLVPTQQAQNRMVELFFNKELKVPDSIFYDGSSWTVALAFGIPYAPVSNNAAFASKKPFSEVERTINLPKRSEYAYLIKWTDSEATPLLSYLLKEDVLVYTALKPFSTQVDGSIIDYGAGTLVIPVSGQLTSSDRLFEILTTAAGKYRPEITAVHTGYNARGIDLGSNNVRPLLNPKYSF